MPWRPKRACSNSLCGELDCRNTSGNAGGNNQAECEGWIARASVGKQSEDSFSSAIELASIRADVDATAQTLITSFLDAKEAQTNCGTFAACATLTTRRTPFGLTKGLVTHRGLARYENRENRQ